MGIMMRGERTPNMVETKYLSVFIHQHHNVHNMLSMNLQMIDVTIEIIIAMMREQE